MSCEPSAGRVNSASSSARPVSTAARAWSTASANRSRRRKRIADRLSCARPASRAPHLPRRLPPRRARQQRGCRRRTSSGGRGRSARERARRRAQARPRPVEQGACAARFAGLEVVAGGVDRAAPRTTRVVRGRQRASFLEQLGRSTGAPRARASRAASSSTAATSASGPWPRVPGAARVLLERGRARRAGHGVPANGRPGGLRRTPLRAEDARSGRALRRRRPSPPSPPASARTASNSGGRLHELERRVGQRGRRERTFRVSSGNAATRAPTSSRRAGIGGVSPRTSPGRSFRTSELEREEWIAARRLVQVAEGRTGSVTPSRVCSESTCTSLSVSGPRRTSAYPGRTRSGANSAPSAPLSAGRS